MTVKIIRLTGIGNDGLKLISIEPHWWDIGVLWKNFNLSWVSTSEPGYEDNDADVSLEEAKLIHERFKPKLLELIKTNSEAAESTRHRTENLDPPRENAYAEYVRELNSDLVALDSAFDEKSCDYSHFHICIYEWDSGL